MLDAKGSSATLLWPPLRQVRCSMATCLSGEAAYTPDAKRRATAGQ